MKSSNKWESDSIIELTLPGVSDLLPYSIIKLVMNCFFLPVVWQSLWDGHTHTLQTVHLQTPNGSPQWTNFHIPLQEIKKEWLYNKWAACISLSQHFLYTGLLMWLFICYTHRQEIDPKIHSLSSYHSHLPPVVAKQINNHILRIYSYSSYCSTNIVVITLPLINKCSLGSFQILFSLV